MIWILATRGASTRLRSSPFTETAIEGVHSVVYRPGIAPIVFSGADGDEGPEGTFDRGVHRVSGFVFSYHGLAAETLLGINAEIDLIVRYRANQQIRRRVFADILFVGDAVVTMPPLNVGVSPIIGVPFRVQRPIGETLAEHIADTIDS
jgi:hypothetical protein